LIGGAPGSRRRAREIDLGIDHGRARVAAYYDQGVLQSVVSVSFNHGVVEGLVVGNDNIHNDATGWICKSENFEVTRKLDARHQQKQREAAQEQQERSVTVFPAETNIHRLRFACGFFVVRLCFLLYFELFYFFFFSIVFFFFFFF